MVHISIFGLLVKCINSNILQRDSSDPSEQSNSPSHTFDFRIHCLFEHVASFKPQTSTGRTVTSTPEKNYYYYSFYIFIMHIKMIL